MTTGGSMFCSYPFYADLCREAGREVDPRLDPALGVRVDPGGELSQFDDDGVCYALGAVRVREA